MLLWITLLMLGEGTGSAPVAPPPPELSDARLARRRRRIVVG